MITAVDTNILLDVFLPDNKFASSSAKLLKLAYDEGALITRDRGFYRSYFPDLQILSLESEKDGSRN